jgi:hypothetical protein
MARARRMVWAAHLPAAAAHAEWPEDLPRHLQRQPRLGRADRRCPHRRLQRAR